MVLEHYSHLRGRVEDVKNSKMTLFRRVYCRRRGMLDNMSVIVQRTIYAISTPVFQSPEVFIFNAIGYLIANTIYDVVAWGTTVIEMSIS